MNWKTRFLLCGLVFVMLLFTWTHAAATSYVSNGSGNWTTTTIWTPNGTPGPGDNVTVSTGHTVTFNTSANISSLTVNGILQPDASSTRVITLDGSLTVTGAGARVYFDNVGDGTGTGRLSWILTANDISPAIINNATNVDYLKVYNLTVQGNTNESDANGFHIYGNFSDNLANFDATVGTGTITFDNVTASTNTLTNTGGDVKFYNLVVAASKVLNTSSDFTVTNNLTISGTLNQSNPSTLTMTGAANNLTNTGTYTVNTGASLVINGTITLANSLSNFAGALTVNGTKKLIVTTGKTISGTGDFTLASGATLQLSNAGGVNSTINLSGTRSFNQAANYIFVGGTTGFTSAGISQVNDIQVTGTVTTSESFTMTGNLTITGANSLVANGGTITFSGSPTTISAAGGGTLTLNNLTIPTTFSATIAAATLISLNGNLSVDGTMSITNAATSSIDFTGNTTISGAGTLDIGNWDIDGNVTLARNLTLQAVANTVTLNSGIFDVSTFTISSSSLSTPAVTLGGGTFRTANNNGLKGSLVDATFATVGELSISNAVSLEFNGTASQTTMGMTFTTAPAGTGVTVLNVTGCTNLTISNASAIAGLGSGAANVLAISGNLTISGTASLILPYSAADDLLTLSGAAKTIAVTSSAVAPLQFNGLTVTGTISTTANYTIVGVLTGGGTFTNTSNTVTYTPGVNNIASPASTGISFYNLNLTGANNLQPTATANFTIAGDLVIGGAGNFDGGTNASSVTLSGTGKGIYRAAASGTLAFRTLIISGTYTAYQAGLTSTINGISLATSLVADFTIAAAGTLNISGTFTAATGQTVTYTAAGTLSGAGTKTFYNVVQTGAGAIASAVNLTIANNFTLAGVAWTQSAGTLTMTGAAATITTVAGTNLVMNTGALVIANGAVVTFSNACTVTGAGSVTVAAGGKIVISAAPTVSGTGSFIAIAGSTINYDAAAQAQGIGALLTATTVTLNSGVDYEIAGTTAHAGFDNTPVINVPRNITVITAGLTNLDGALTISGNFTVNGGGSYIEGTPATALTMSGASATITNGGTLNFGVLTINGIVTTASSFSVLQTGASALTVNALKSLIASAGTITFGGAAPQLLNNGTLTFYNLASTGDLAGGTSSFTVSNNFDISAAGASYTATGGTITLTGTAAQIKTVGDATAATLGITFWNVLISGTYTQSGNFIIDVSGSTLNVTGSFIPGTGSINLVTNGTTISNTGTLTFNNLLIDRAAGGTVVVTTASSFGIGGALTLAAATDAFVCTAGTITLSGIAAITPFVDYAATPVGIKFNNLSVSGTYTQAGNIINLIGNLEVTSTGNFTPGAGTINFDGGTTKTISNAGTLQFFDLAVANTASNNVTTTSTFNIADNMSVGGAAGGTFVATGGTISFNAAAAHTLTNSTSSAAGITFYNLANTTTGSLTLQAGITPEFYVKGNLTNSSTGNINLTVANGKLWLNGSTEQILTKTSTGTLLLRYATVQNSSSGVKLVGFTTSGDFSVSATLKIQQGYIDLNGDNIITLATGTGILQELVGNTVRNNGPSSSVGYVKYDKIPGAALSNENLGGLGAQMTTTSDPGTITIKRYHIARTPGDNAGISRYFSINSTNTCNSSSLTFKYDTTELNGLTESQLSLVSSSAAAGPWITRTATLNTLSHFLKATSLTDFTAGSTSFWTASAPTLTTISLVNKGVGSLRYNNGMVNGVPTTSDTLTASTTKAVIGFKINSTSAATLNSLQVDFTNALAGTFNTATVKLYSSTDDDFSTTGDNTLIKTGSLSTATSIVFSTLSQSLTAGTSKYYFVTADVVAGVTIATSTNQASVSTANMSLTGSVINNKTVSGPTFNFQPGINIALNPSGTAVSPLVAGAQNQAIMGFSANGTSNTSFTGFMLASNIDLTSVPALSNVYLYRSTSNNFDFTVPGQNTLIATGAITSAGITFNMASSEALLITNKYYFVVANVSGAVDPNTTSLNLTFPLTSFKSYNLATPSLTDELAAPVSNSTLTPSSYSFVNSKVNVTTANMTAAGNLGKGVANQPLYGFTLTSANGNSVTLNGIQLAVAFTNSATDAQFSNWRIWYDANENGYPDATETNFSGTYANGYVTFATTAVPQSFSTYRKFIVTASVSSAATTNGTIQLTLTDQTYITMLSPTVVSVPATPWYGNLQTIKVPGAAAKLAFSPFFLSSVITGANVSYTAVLQDANGTPVNAGVGGVTLTFSTNSGSTLGSGAGSIGAGTFFGTLTTTLTNAVGVTGETISLANASALVNPSSLGPITVYPAAPAAYGLALSATYDSVSAAVTYTANGAPTGVIIVLKANRPPTDPTNGVDYSAPLSQNIGDASAAANQTADGSFVIYAGANATNTFNVYGLTPNTAYYAMVYPYTGASGLKDYVTTKSAVNPYTFTTTAGSFGDASSTGLAKTISTDVDVNGYVANANSNVYYQFVVPSSRNNLLIRLTNLPSGVNYWVDLLNSDGTLRRRARSTNIQNQTIVIDNVVSGKYLLRIYGADANQYSNTQTFTVRVNTAATANKYYSQPSN